MWESDVDAGHRHQMMHFVQNVLLVAVKTIVLLCVMFAGITGFGKVLESNQHCHNRFLAFSGLPQPQVVQRQLARLYKSERRKTVFVVNPLFNGCVGKDGAYWLLATASSESSSSDSERDTSASDEVSSYGTSTIGTKLPSELQTIASDDSIRGHPRYSSDIATLSQPQLASGTTETLPFQAEVSRVMDIIVNSLYTDRDVFLRELVSNAADACDKKKVLLTQSGAYTNQGNIKIKADKENSLLMIEDDGIGMTREELISNLGTIAQSGTAKFLQQVAEGSTDASLIGQFGVGFYSAYLVANKVEVLSRRYDGDGSLWLWQSGSGGTFMISKLLSNNVTMNLFENGGTKVTLHIKEDCDEYLEDYKIKELLKKYSEFIQFPIEVWSEKVEYDRVPDTSSITKPGEKQKMKTVTKKRYEWERVNLLPPIWRRNKDDIKPEEYHEFYKTTFKAYDDPLGYTHFNVEGQVDFSALLFVPGSLPWELSKSMFDDQSRGIRLYVKRVFINDKFSESMPRWLIFIRGVVDSEDLPLNVGREILQKSKMLTIINKRLTEKAIEMIRQIKAEGGMKWEKFRDNYGKYLKVGVVETRDNQEDIASLIEFWSTHSGQRTTDLDGYIKRMKANQTAIYFVAGDSRTAASESPALEKLKQLDYEVLYCTEPVDEFCLSTLSISKYRNHEVLDATKENIRLAETANDDEKEKRKQKKLEMEGLCDWMLGYFGKKIEKVTVSERLTESPAILVQSDFGLSPTMQRYIKQQSVSTGQSGGSAEIMGMNMNQAILELNPDHFIIKQLQSLVANDKDSRIAAEIAELILDVASLQGGYTIENPSLFGKRITNLMTAQAKQHIARNMYNEETINLKEKFGFNSNEENVRNLENNSTIVMPYADSSIKNDTFVNITDDVTI